MVPKQNSNCLCYDSLTNQPGIGLSINDNQAKIAARYLDKPLPGAEPSISAATLLGNVELNKRIDRD